MKFHAKILSGQLAVRVNCTVNGQLLSGFACIKVRDSIFNIYDLSGEVGGPAQSYSTFLVS